MKDRVIDDIIHCRDLVSHTNQIFHNDLKNQMEVPYYILRAKGMGDTNTDHLFAMQNTQDESRAHGSLVLPTLAEVLNNSF